LPATKRQPFGFSSLSLLRDAGLNNDEIVSLVFANRNPIPELGSDCHLSAEDARRFRLVAGLLARCLSVYGSKNALPRLHEPILRFHRQSPLQFLEATSNFDEVDEYLIQIAEGYYA
jgi:hypothetical protein